MEDDMVVGSGRIASLIIDPNVSIEAKAAVESVSGVCLQMLGEIHAEMPDGSIDRLFVEVVASTFKKVMSHERLDRMADLVKQRLAEKA